MGYISCGVQKAQGQVKSFTIVLTVDFLDHTYLASACIVNWVQEIVPVLAYEDQVQEIHPDILIHKRNDTPGIMPYHVAVIFASYPRYAMSRGMLIICITRNVGSAD